MNLGCVDQAKHGKFSLPNEDRNKTLNPTLLLLKQPGFWTPVPRVAGTVHHQTPIAQSDHGSKEIHLGPPGLAPADILVMLPLNSVVKALHWKGDCPVCPRSVGGRDTSTSPAGRWLSPEDGLMWKKHKVNLLSCTTETKMGPTVMKSVSKPGIWSSPSEMNMPINSHWGIQGLGRGEQDTTKRLGISTAFR